MNNKIDFTFTATDKEEKEFLKTMEEEGIEILKKIKVRCDKKRMNDIGFIIEVTELANYWETQIENQRHYYNPINAESCLHQLQKIINKYKSNEKIK